MTETRPRWRSSTRLVLIALTLGGLAIDAYVHIKLAPTFDPVRTSVLSEGDLFRAESAVAILAAVALLVRPRRYTALFAAAVAGTGAAALFAYGYYDIPAFGPIPSMYDPFWSPDKTAAAIAEIAATVTALGALILMPRRRTTAWRSARKGSPEMAPSPAP